MNSQSGKGGMAYLLKANHNLDLPKKLLPAISAATSRASRPFLMAS